MEGHSSSFLLDRSQALLSKIAHGIHGIRNRAIENVCFKLSTGLIESSDVLQHRVAMNALVNLLAKYQAEYEKENVTVETALFRLLGFLSAKDAQGLAQYNIVGPLQKIQSQKLCTKENLKIISKIMTAILACPSPQNSIKISTFSSSVDLSEEIRRPLQPRGSGAAAATSGLGNLLAPLSLNHGWRFPLVRLIQSDERILHDLGAQLSNTNNKGFMRACKKLKLAFYDFPAEVFLQRPNIIKLLISRATFPVSDVASPPGGSFTDTDVRETATATLTSFVCSLRKSLRLQLDEGMGREHGDGLVEANTTPSEVSYVKESEFSYPNTALPAQSSMIEEGNTSQGLSVGFIAMNIFISGLSGLNNKNSLHTRKLLREIIPLLVERFPFSLRNSTGRIVSNVALDCARIEQCISAFVKTVEIVTVGTDEETLLEDGLLSVVDLKLLLQLMGLASPSRLCVGNSKSAMGGMNLKVMVPVSVVRTIRFIVQDEGLALNQPELRSNALPILAAIDEASYDSFMHSRKIIEVVRQNQMRIKDLSESGPHKSNIVDRFLHSVDAKLLWGIDDFSKCIDNLSQLLDSLLCYESMAASDFQENSFMLVLDNLALCVSLQQSESLENEKRNVIFNKSLALFLASLNSPMTKLRIEAYSQLTQLLDFLHLDRTAPRKIAETVGPIHEFYTSICLNSEVLKLSFAHSFGDSGNGVVSKHASQFLQKAIALVPIYEYAASQFAPFRIYLQCYGDTLDQKINPSSLGRLASSSIKKAFDLTREYSSNTEHLLETVRSMMHQNEGVRKAASVRLREIVPSLNRFVGAVNMSMRVLQDPFSTVDKSLQFFDENEISAGFGNSIEVAVEDLYRFGDLISSDSTSSLIWETAASQCSSILLSREFVKTYNAGRHGIGPLMELWKASIKRVTNSGLEEQKAAMRLAYTLIAQFNHRSAALVSNISDVEVILSFLFHTDKSLRTMACAIVARMCFQGAYYNEKSSTAENKNSVSQLQLNEMFPPLEIFQCVEKVFPVRDFLPFMNVDVIDPASRYTGAFSVKYEERTSISNMVGNFFGAQNLNKPSAKSRFIHTNLLTQSAILLEKVTQSKSHNECIVALKALHKFCLVEPQLSKAVVAIVNWFGTFRNFFEISPTSKKDFKILKLVIDVFCTILPHIGNSELVLTAIVLRDNLIPLLKKGKCVAKNTSSISSDVLELLQGNGYERVDEQRTFIVTESKEKCELNESILKLIVCMTRRRLNNFELKKDILHSMFVETDLLSVLALEYINSHVSTIQEKLASLFVFSLAYCNYSMIQSDSVKKRSNSVICSLVQIVRAHRMPQSFCGHEILRKSLVVLHKLATYGLGSECPGAWAGVYPNEDFGAEVGGIILSWCRRLFRDREIHVRSLGRTILSAHLQATKRIFKSLILCAENECEDGNSDNVDTSVMWKDGSTVIPDFVFKAFSSACDREEAFLVRGSSLRIITDFLKSLSKWKKIDRNSSNWDAAEGPTNHFSKSFLKKVVFPSVVKIMDIAPSSATLSLETVKLLVTLDGIYAELTTLEDGYLFELFNEFGLWHKLLEGMNRKTHWEGFARHTVALFQSHINEEEAINIVPPPPEVEMTFRHEGYSFSADVQDAAALRTSEKFCPLTKTEVWNTWYSVHLGDSSSCCGLISHVMQRALYTNCEKGDTLFSTIFLRYNSLDKLMSCSNATAYVQKESGKRISSDMVVHQNEWNANSSNVSFELIQAVKLLTNRVSLGHKPPILKPGSALRERVMRVFKSLLSDSSPSNVRCASCMLLASVMSCDPWKNLVSPSFFCKETNSSGSSKDTEDLGIVRTLLGIFFEKYSEIDLEVSTPLNKEHVFLTREHHVPTNQYEKNAICYGIRALLEGSSQCKNYVYQSGFLSLILEQMHDIHTILSLRQFQPLDDEMPAEISKNFVKGIRCHLKVCLGVLESTLVNSESTRTNIVELGGWKTLNKILTYLYATEIKTSCLEEDALMCCILRTIVNFTSGATAATKKTICSSKTTLNYLIALGRHLSVARSHSRDDNTIFEDMMRFTYGIISNVSLEQSCFKAIVRSGFIDGNVDMLESYSLSLKKSEGKKKSAITLATKKRRLIILKNFIRLSITQHGREALGRNKTIIDFIKRALAKPVTSKFYTTGTLNASANVLQPGMDNQLASLLLLRNIIFSHSNKVHLIANSELFKIISAKLSDKRINISAFAADCLRVLVFNCQKIKAVIREPATQRILLSAIFNTKKNLKLADIQSNRMLAYKSNAIEILSQI
jgi:hypothetical protein